MPARLSRAAGSPWRRRVLGLLVFLATFAVGLACLATRYQLEHQGAEEYFTLGLNLRRSGRFLPDESFPFVFRPPGYPVFIASVLMSMPAHRLEQLPFNGAYLDRLANIARAPDLPTWFREPAAILDAAFDRVFFTQAVLLALSAAVLFSWLSRGIGTSTAFVFALLFGTCPYLIILNGVLRYPILHVFLTVVSCAALGRSLESGTKRTRWALWAGILWGITTLARPQTLLLPLFILPSFLLTSNRNWRAALKLTAAVTLSMALVVGPYTVRNYVLTKRFIPVNAQLEFGLWAVSSQRLPRDPNASRWRSLWADGGPETFLRLTGQNYGMKALIAGNLEAADAFRAAGIRNLKQNPGVYLSNLLTNFVTFNVDINSILIDFFKVAQEPRKPLVRHGVIGPPVFRWDPRMPVVLHDIMAPRVIRWDTPPPRSATATAFALHFHMLTVMSLLAVGLAVWRRDAFLLAAVAVYACFCFTHTITFMDFWYYYIKIPFLFFFTAYLIDRAGNGRVPLPVVGGSVPLAYLLNGLLLVFGLSLTVAGL